MRTQPIPHTDLHTTRLSYGCMRIAGTWNPSEITPARAESAEAALNAAFDAGYRLFDHADIYCAGGCEQLFGQWLSKSPNLRKEMIVATKCGIRFPGEPNPDSPHRYDFSKEHILTSCDLSLKRLGIETIDIYQLHRPDLLMNPAEVAEAFDTLRRQGKVRYFGVSNFLPSFASALQSALPSPLVVNQVEIHLGRLDCFEDGTLDQCIETGMMPLSWSPLGGGFLGQGGTVWSEHPRHDAMVKLLAKLDEIAERLGVSRTVLSLAWLMKHPSGIVPIVGSTKPDHIRDAAKADDLDVSREDWYRLLIAARGAGLP